MSGFFLFCSSNQSFCIVKKKACSVWIKGRVQQVGFRFHAREAAIGFGVKGFIRNRPDGSVYAEVEGEVLAVDLFIQWCKKGPSWARVDNALVCDIPLQDFEQFTIT